MAHGQPDYGAYAAKSTVFSMSDLGELAARLGSIVTFDRRGDVVFLDDFSDGMVPYHKLGSGTGWSVAQSSARSKSGGYSVLLTAGSDALHFAQILKYLPYPVAGNLGVEVSFTMHADVVSLQLFLSLYDGAKVIQPAIRYVQADNDLTYKNSAGGNTTLDADLKLLEADYMFHTVKLVVDYSNKKYVRCLVDHNSYDMADIDIYEEANATDPCLLMIVYNSGEAGKNAAVYVDNLIITQNEPD